MWKKYLSLLMAGMLLATLCGCAKKQESSEKDNTESAEEAEEIQEEEEETDEGQTENDQTDEIEIELPQESQLAIDYTLAEGLELPPKTRIAVVAKTTKGNYWKAIRTGMEMAVEDLNEAAGLEGNEKVTMTFEGPDQEDDAEHQINIVDAVLAENPQVLCLAAIDVESCSAQLENAQENGIPVIGFDSGVSSKEMMDTICKTDNYGAGAEAARRLAAAVGDFGEILIVSSQQNTESLTDRVLGFESEITNAHKTVTIVDTVYGDDPEDDRSLEERIREILENHPNLKGCFVTDENAAAEVLDILKNPEYQDMKLAGFDASEKQLKAVREGREVGIICQNPYGMGYATVISAARAILTLDNDEMINAGYQWIDQGNIDLEENQKYLYE